MEKKLSRPGIAYWKISFVFIFLATVITLSSCETEPRKISSDDHGENEEAFNNMNQLRSTNDSLRNVILKFEDELQTFKRRNKPVTSETENEIHEMVFDMHKSWENLPASKDPNTIQKYFLKRFAVNQLTVNTDNDEAQIVGYTNDDFQKYLKEVIRRKGRSYKFEDVIFLDTEIKSNVYFHLAYKCNLKIYDKSKLVNTNTLMVTITGKSENEKWKIGNYSWVSFEYE